MTMPINELDARDTIDLVNAPSQEEVELSRAGVTSTQEVVGTPPVKQKIELRRVESPVEQALPLKVNMARQASEYFIGPSWPELASLTKPFNYILQEDGLWEVRNVQAGWLVRQREKFTKKLPGFLEDKKTEYGVPRYGKIPAQIYWEIESFFRSICNESGDEVYVQTFWDPEQNKYFNHVPKQTVSGASVRYDRDQELEARCPLVVETHSHNRMNAFFSGVDNNDEKSDRFFGVLGKLNTPSPEVKYSFLCGGVRTDIPISDIFDMGPSHTFPEAWKDQVTRQAAIVTKPWAYGGVAGTGNYSYPGYEGKAWERSAGHSGQYRPAQGSLWRGSSYRPSEAKKEIEEAAKKAEKEVNGDYWDTSDFLSQDEDAPHEGLTHRPFFRHSLTNLSKEESNLKDTIADIIVDLSDLERVNAMSDEEKQQLFQNLVEVLSEDDVTLLTELLATNGYGEFMLAALDEPDDGDFEVSDESSE